MTAGAGGHPDRPDADPGLARARTSLAWTRTVLSFATAGGVLLKEHLVPGLIILAAAPVVWYLGRLSYRLPGRLKLVTVTIVGVSVIALAAVVAS